MRQTRARARKGSRRVPALAMETAMTAPFEIFLIAPPGLEAVLCQEALEQGFAGARVVEGGVAFDGLWPDVWRANLVLRGAGRVLARIADFRVMHLAQLDKRARKLEWGDVLLPGIPVRVEASCRRSRIYHAGAAAQRIETALREEFGAVIAEDAPVSIRARIEDDLCTISVDTSGEMLHKRGHKEAVNRAPMRETMASLFLRQCGYRGTEPVLDPMCGSGTFVIEAAEMAAGLAPGRARNFAFEHLASFDEAEWADMRRDAEAATQEPDFRFFGSDRDGGAIAMSRANAERAGTAAFSEFRQAPISKVERPDGPPGLVIVNPPYGGRIGEKAKLKPLYEALGATLREKFGGWRVGIITTDANLARATGLAFKAPPPPVLHGGLRVTLFATETLA